MTTYAIGDIQGCYSEFMALLELIKFNPLNDQLWCVGDLINRGPQSLEVLDYLMNLPKAPIVTLGNHDLHFLAVAIGDAKTHHLDTLDHCLQSPKLPTIVDWLRAQPLVHDDPQEGYTMVHAGIPPQWTLEQALEYASELSEVIRGPRAKTYFQAMYGSHPDHWDTSLQGMDRYRVITNYFTRMRFCDAQGVLELQSKESKTHPDPRWKPWFTIPRVTPLPRPVIFGHWAALEGETGLDDRIGIDTGCVWGGALTAIRLKDRQRFQVKSHLS